MKYETGGIRKISQLLGYALYLCMRDAFINGARCFKNSGAGYLEHGAETEKLVLEKMKRLNVFCARLRTQAKSVRARTAAALRINFLRIFAPPSKDLYKES